MKSRDCPAFGTAPARQGRKYLCGWAEKPFPLFPFPFRDGGTDIVKSEFHRKAAANKPFRTFYVPPPLKGEGDRGWG